MKTADSNSGSLAVRPTCVTVAHVHPAPPDVSHPIGKDLGADVWGLMHEGVVRRDTVVAPRDLTGTIHVQS